jgi:hypothetical protein
VSFRSNPLRESAGGLPATSALPEACAERAKWEMTTTEVAVAERKATDVTLTGGGGNRDVYMAVADAVAPKHVQGSLLKFNKGEWLAGEKQEIVPNGTRVIAAVDQILMGWVFWEDGKPTDHRMVLVSSGEAPARRAELGDLDQSRWEKDASGELRDPWAMTFYVPMVDDTGEVFTFSTTSRGGKNAVADILRHYSRNRNSNPGKFPVMALESDTYQHSNAQYGRIKYPVFKQVGWENQAVFWKAVGVTEGVDETPAVEQKTANDMGDRIPF